MFRSTLIFVWIVAFALSLCLGCKGPEGPQGPAGPQGDPGPGTRKVYSGTASGLEYEVSVPEVDITNMPNLGVYVRFYGKKATTLGGNPELIQGGWTELPFCWTDGSYIYFQYLSIEAGKVTLIGCDGEDYRIVVVQ